MRAPSISPLSVRQKRSWLNRRLPYIYGAFIIVGFLLVDWAGYDLLLPDPAPYRYELISEGTIGDFPDLHFSTSNSLLVKKYEARLDADGSPFAEFYVGDLGAEIDPILLDWQNRSDDLELTLSGRPKELNQLLEAVRTHVPEDAVVLSWWDTSAQLRALTAAQIKYEGNLLRPLFIPSEWTDDISAIHSLESIFWRISEEKHIGFEKFIDALSSPFEQGIHELHKIVGKQKAFVIIQLSDMYKISLVRPTLIDVGFQKFDAGSEIHDDIVRVKRWLEENQLNKYAVEASSITSRRIYYIKETGGAETLITKMLPLSGFNPGSLDGLKLVANYGSYWVYEVVHPDDASLE